MKLRHPPLVFCLEDREVVDATRAEPPHRLHTLQWTQPVERKKCLVRADPHNAAAPKLAEVQRVVRRKCGIRMAGANKSDVSNRIDSEVLAKLFVQREERRLHRLHKQPIVSSGNLEDPLQLSYVERGRLLAHHV